MFSKVPGAKKISEKLSGVVRCSKVVADFASKKAPELHAVLAILETLPVIGSGVTLANLGAKVANAGAK